MNLEEKIGKFLTDNNLTISTVESCTGGLLSSRLTDVSGSSAYITLNLVTYANEAKNHILGVSKEILETKGAVSPECAEAMAKGLYNLTKSDICVSTTGIAGPTGGSPDKPVGLMYSAIHTPENCIVNKIILNPDTPRKEMKYQFTEEALKRLLEYLTQGIRV